jgi:hypothetical protein
MADFSCASTKRTSVRFRVSVVVAALVLTGCNANQEINPSSQPPSQVFAATTWTTILTILSAMHRTTPGAAAVVEWCAHASTIRSRWLAGISQCAPRLAEVAPWRGDRGRPVDQCVSHSGSKIFPGPPP